MTIANWLSNALEPVNQVIFTIGRDPVTWAELLGFITGVACVCLAAVQRISNWPIGIANSIFFGLLFIDARLWADASLQVVYVVLGAFGWWAWLRLGPQRTSLEVAWASRSLLFLVAIGVAATAALLEPILRAAHDSAPLLDAVTTALSLGGQTLLCLKRVENWYWWIAADIVYIPLYTSRHLYLTAAVYAVFLTICLRAVVQWRTQAQLAPNPA